MTEAACNTALLAGCNGALTDCRGLFAATQDFALVVQLERSKRIDRRHAYPPFSRGAVAASILVSQFEAF
jgi:hypothetical protein